MRQAGLVVGLMLVFFVTTGVNECYPPGTNSERKVMCGKDVCTVAIHLNDQCLPVDAAGRSMQRTYVQPKTDVCFFNDTKCNFRLTFKPALFGADHTTVMLAPGACAHMVVLPKAARKKISYEIGCDCKDAGGGHGNPDFVVGGGGGSGGGGGGGGG